MINRLEQITNLKKELTFEPKDFYPGLADQENKSKLIDLFGNIIDDFISGLKQNYTDQDYVNLIAKNIVQFDIYNLDTEDREYICSSFEKIMNIIGLKSSNGVLNKWIYGFDI